MCRRYSRTLHSLPCEATPHNHPAPKSAAEQPFIPNLGLPSCWLRTCTRALCPMMAVRALLEDMQVIWARTSVRYPESSRSWTHSGACWPSGRLSFTSSTPWGNRVTSVRGTGSVGSRYHLTVSHQELCYSGTINKTNITGYAGCADFLLLPLAILINGLVNIQFASYLGLRGTPHKFSS